MESILEIIAEHLNESRRFYQFSHIGGPVGFKKDIWWGIAPGGALFGAITTLERRQNFRQIDREWWQRNVGDWVPFPWNDEGDLLIVPRGR